MRTIKTEGIIIKRKNFGEADRLLTVITPYFGKLTIKATGVRKITSRRSAHIELLNHSALNLYKGSGMHVLTEVKMIDDHAAIKMDFTKVGLAYHMCELIDGLCPEGQENGNAYYLLKNALRQIARQVQEEAVSAQVPVQAYLRSEIDDYTLGTFGLGVKDVPRVAPLIKEESLAKTLHTFEIALLSELGYWNKEDPLSKNFDTHTMIESILERKLKSHNIFTKLQ
ncbi:MAG: DNA repair protein RecO [Candidatus Levybacteria bacterium]|nr:DNA repair protein RecO [Candidatus Levybacteria bacterium]